MNDSTSNPIAPRRRRLYSAPPETDNVALQEVSELVRLESSRTQLNKDHLRARAQTLVFQSSVMAAGAGVLPLEMFSVGAGAAIHVGMTVKLASVYGIKLSEKNAKLLVTAAVSGVGSEWIGAGLAKQAFFANWLGSLVSGAVIPGGLTYALGQWLIRHFESITHSASSAPSGGLPGSATEAV